MNPRKPGSPPLRWSLDLTGAGDPPCYSIVRHRLPGNTEPPTIGHQFQVVDLSEGTATFRVGGGGAFQVSVGDDIFEACKLEELVENWGEALVVSISRLNDVTWVEIDLGGILFRLRVGQDFALRTDSSGRDWRPIVKFPELAIIVGDKAKIFKNDRDGALEGFLALLEIVDSNSAGAVLSIDGVVIPLDNNAGVQILPSDDKSSDNPNPDNLPPLAIYVRTMLTGRSVQVFIDGDIAEFPTFCARRFDDVVDRIPTISSDSSGAEHQDDDDRQFAASA